MTLPTADLLAATVSCSGTEITIQCNDHDVKDRLMDFLTGESSPSPLALEVYDQCIQCVRAYGPPLGEHHRAGIIAAIEHFKCLFERDYK